MQISYTYLYNVIKNNINYFASKKYIWVWIVTIAIQNWILDNRELKSCKGRGWRVQMQLVLWLTAPTYSHKCQFYPCVVLLKPFHYQQSCQQNINLQVNAAEDYQGLGRRSVWYPHVPPLTLAHVVRLKAQAAEMTFYSFLFNKCQVIQQQNIHEY